MSQHNNAAILVMISIAAFLTPFMGSAVNLALPAIAHDFNYNMVNVGWIASSFILSTAVFLIPMGRIADLHGRKKIFNIGCVLFTLASLLCAISTSGTGFLAARALQGLASAMVFGTSTAILTSVFPPQQRGKVMGINVSAVYLGLALGPVLGGLLTETFGWRSIFWVPTILGSLVLLLSTLHLKGEWADAQGESFDWIGSLLYGTSIVASLFGSTLLPSTQGFVLIATGIFLLIGFVLLESKIRHPVFNVKLLHSNPMFAYSGLAALLNYSATFAITFLLSLYLQNIKGLDPRHAGFILLVSPVMMTLGSPLAGRLSDRIHPGILASLGMGLIGLALLAFLALDQHTSLTYIIVCMACIGTGMALFSSPNANAIMSSVEKRYLGIASSMMGTLRLVGQMVAMGLTMLVFTLVIGRIKLSPEMFALFLRASHILFIMFAVLCALGIFSSLARTKTPLSNR